MFYTTWDIGMIRLDGESEPEILLGTPFDEQNGMISPDGRWLAYVSNESGREEVYVRPFPGLGGKVQVSMEGGTEPMWAPDGKELFYRDRKKMMVVPVTTETDFKPGTPKLLFEGPYQTGLWGGISSNFDIMPDGEQFVMIRPAERSTSQQLNIVLNWYQELKRLVSAGN
jgi:hypothetical protein